MQQSKGQVDIDSKYWKRIIESALGKQKIDLNADLTVNAFGLDGMPVSALHLTPSTKAKLAEKHILSLGTLCGLEENDLQPMSSAYVYDVRTELHALGLSFGMRHADREAYSRYQPSAALLERWPDFKKKTAAFNEDSSVLSPNPNYVKFKFRMQSDRTRFVQRAESIFAFALNEYPELKSLLSSQALEIRPIHMFKPYTKTDASHTTVYAISMRRDMLRVLAEIIVAAKEHPALLQPFIDQDASQERGEQKRPRIVEEILQSRVPEGGDAPTHASKQEKRPIPEHRGFDPETESWAHEEIRAAFANDPAGRAILAKADKGR